MKPSIRLIGQKNRLPPSVGYFEAQPHFHRAGVCGETTSEEDDNTQMVTSWVAEELLLEPAVLSELRDFLCMMGRETNQGEIGIVINGTYFGIVD